jgi:hypothetical protein
MTAIPDPERPEEVAILPDGRLAGGVFIVKPANPAAPTFAELQGGTHIGWTPLGGDDA